MRCRATEPPIFLRMGARGQHPPERSLRGPQPLGDPGLSAGSPVLIQRPTDRRDPEAGPLCRPGKFLVSCRCLHFWHFCADPASRHRDARQRISRVAGHRTRSSLKNHGDNRNRACDAQRKQGLDWAQPARFQPGSGRERVFQQAPRWVVPARINPAAACRSAAPAAVASHGHCGEWSPWGIGSRGEWPFRCRLGPWRSGCWPR